MAERAITTPREKIDVWSSDGRGLQCADLREARAFALQASAANVHVAFSMASAEGAAARTFVFDHVTKCWVPEELSFHAPSPRVSVSGTPPGPEAQRKSSKPDDLDRERAPGDIS